MRAVLAFVVACVIATGATAVLRRVAIATDFVDRPARGKSHAHATPYLGGIAIVLATVVAWMLEPGVSTALAVVAIAGVGVALVGLVDDDRGLHPLVRLVAEAGAAAAVIAAGVRLEPTGVAIVDVAVTLVWIVGITNALNLMDNMDGLAAGVTLPVAGGVVALAAYGGQDALATAAAGIGGAATGFLVHNWRPASIFMGDAGALFLGFVLSVVAVEVRPDVGRPASVVVPLLLLAVPLLDTTTVTVARIRHGQSVAHGGTDHLSHRFVALGAPPALAVTVLIAAQGAFALLAVLLGTGALPLAWALVGAVAVAGAIVGAATRARVYERDAVRWHVPRRRQRVVRGDDELAPMPVIFVTASEERAGLSGE